MSSPSIHFLKFKSNCKSISVKLNQKPSVKFVTNLKQVITKMRKAVSLQLKTLFISGCDKTPYPSRPLAKQKREREREREL